MTARVHFLLARLLRDDMRPWLTVFICALAGFAFLKLGSEMLEGETHAFDRAVLLALRASGDTHDPIGPPWVEQVASDLTSLGSLAVLTFVFLGSAGYLVMRRKWADVVVLAFAVPGGLLLSTGLKAFYDRPRPDLVPEAVAHLNASFPSGHAMLSAITYLTLAALMARAQSDRRGKIYLFALAITATMLVGLTRVYLGLHWPSDVLGGWCLGASWAALSRLAVDYAPVLARRLNLK